MCLPAWGAETDKIETNNVRVTVRERPYGDGKEDISVSRDAAGYGPECFAVGRNRNIYICDTVNRRIQVYSPDFEYLSTLRLQRGTRPDEVVPEDMLIDDRGNIFVYAGGSLRQYDMSGNLIAAVSAGVEALGPNPLRIVAGKIYVKDCNMRGKCGDVLIADISGGVMKALSRKAGPLNNSFIGPDGKILKGYLKGFRVTMSLIEKDVSEKQLEFPHLRDIYSVMVLGEDERGNFYVQTLRDVNKEMVGEIHRFSPEGDLLTTFRQSGDKELFWSARSFIVTNKGTVFYFPKEFEKASIYSYEFESLPETADGSIPLLKVNGALESKTSERKLISDINFADGKLETCVKESGATYTDEITLLSCPKQGITDITGIEWLTGLRDLWLNENSITDISALSNLTGLRLLGLNGNSIEDIKALSGLPGLLSDLNLSNNRITDISGLSGLTGLEDLRLTHNNITDISALSSLTGLAGLQLSDNKITDISVLSNLTVLTTLGLINTSISDISSLSGLTGLKGLSLSDNGIRDISALSNLTGLRVLYLNNNGIMDISSLSGLSGLEILELNNNSIKDISPLTGLNHLKDLKLNANNIEDVSPLSGMTGLEQLLMDHNRVTDISPLSGLNMLLYVKLDFNGIEDIRPFSGLTRGVWLRLSNNRIKTGVADLSHLRFAYKIDLRDNSGIPCSELTVLSNALGTAKVLKPASCVPQLEEKKSLAERVAVSFKFKKYLGNSIVYDAAYMKNNLKTDNDFNKLYVRALRNEIFARHGRSFRSEDLQDIFKSTEWYRPDPDYSDDMLDDIERRNVQFILDYEKKMGWR